MRGPHRDALARAAVPRRALLAAALVALGALGVALMLVPPRALAAPVRVAGPPQVTVVATGLEVPWDIAFLPDGRALVTERPGRVRIIGADGRLSPTPAAMISVSNVGEGGLLGIAIDPALSAATPFVYTNATIGSEVQVQRWRLVGDRLQLDATVLSGVQAGSIHDSGRIRFGPDGNLYVTTGDSGHGSLSQDPSSLNGKLLRLTPASYRGAGGAPQQVALGLRNSQGLDWQPGTGTMFVTDHGPSGFDGPSGDDELDRIVQGGNYGWPIVRGTDTGGGLFIAPTVDWVQTIAPSGLAFVKQPGSTWTGNMLVAALKGEQMRRLTLAGDRVIGDEPMFVGAYGRLRAVVEAPDGSIWVTTSNRDGRGTPRAGDDQILRIVPPAAPAGAPGPAPAPGAARPGATLVRVHHLRVTRRIRLGRAIRVTIAFTRSPSRAVVLQRRLGRRWSTLQVARPARVVRLRFTPRTAGVYVLRVRYDSAGRRLTRRVVVRVTPRTPRSAIA